MGNEDLSLVDISDSFTAISVFIALLVSYLRRVVTVLLIDPLGALGTSEGPPIVFYAIVIAPRAGIFILFGSLRLGDKVGSYRWLRQLSRFGSVGS